MEVEKQQTQAYSVEDDNGKTHNLAEATCRMWHFTDIQHLTGPCQPTWRPEYGNGILIDKFMRYGVCTHQNCTGVNVYAYFPSQWFSSGDEWCVVTLECLPYMTKLKGGAKGRYCIRGKETER